MKRRKYVYTDPPLTSEDQYKQTRTKINALNKSRSRAMENRIAKQLRGRRVPMSGAAAKYKGDVEIPFYNHAGNYIIECKLSAQTNVRGESRLRLEFAWFPKLHAEVKSMNAKFGVLIVHFHGNNRDYVFILRQDIEKLIKRYESEYNHIVRFLLDSAPLVDMRFNKGGKPVTATALLRGNIEPYLLKVAGLEGMRMLVPHGEYLVVPLDTFITISRHL